MECGDLSDLSPHSGVWKFQMRREDSQVQWPRPLGLGCSAPEERRELSHSLAMGERFSRTPGGGATPRPPPRQGRED